MVDHIFPIFYYFKKYIQRIYWPSIERIPDLTIPLFFIVGTEDEIVPAVHSQLLNDKAEKAKYK